MIRHSRAKFTHNFWIWTALIPQALIEYLGKTINISLAAQQFPCVGVLWCELHTSKFITTNAANDDSVHALWSLRNIHVRNSIFSLECPKCVLFSLIIFISFFVQQYLAVCQSNNNNNNNEVKCDWLYFSRGIF